MEKLINYFPFTTFAEDEIIVTRSSRFKDFVRRGYDAALLSGTDTLPDDLIKDIAKYVDGRLSNSNVVVKAIFYSRIVASLEYASRNLLIRRAYAKKN